MWLFRLLHLGFDSYVPISEIELITGLPPNTASLKRLIAEARSYGRLINCTRGKRLRSIVVSKTGYVYYSAINAKTLRSRLEGVSSLPDDEL